MATKNKQAAKPVKKEERKSPVSKKGVPAKKAVAVKKAVKTSKESINSKKTAPGKSVVTEKKATITKKNVMDKKSAKEPVAVKKATVNKVSAKTNVGKKNIPAPKIEKNKVPEKVAVVSAKNTASKKALTVKNTDNGKKNIATKKQETNNKKIVGKPVVPEKKTVARPAAKVAAIPVPAAPRAATKPAVKQTVPEKKIVSKLPVKQLPVKTSTVMPRPVATPAARNIEKKPTVIIAHRKLDSKLRTPKEPENTMVSYQPETYRSILDEPEQPQGPVYRYSDEELNEFRELIISRLDAARKELNYLQGLITRKDEAGTEDTENRFMNMEDGSGAMEREQLAQLASRQIQFIGHLEKAMVRIENKTYGICRVTGKLIDKARLRAVPHATLSIEAKKLMASKQN